MLEINLNNVEELVLKDSRLRSLLPDLQSYFDTWLLGQQVAGLKPLAARTKIDFLYAIQPQHLAVIRKYLGRELSIRTFDFRSVANCNCDIGDTLECLDGMEAYSEIVAHRDADSIRITAWR